MKTSLLQRLQSHVAAILTPASARQNQTVDSGFIGVLQTVTSETAPLDNTLISTTNDIAIQGNENTVALSPLLTPENPFIPTIQPESIPIEEAVHTSSITSNSDSTDEAKSLDTQNVATVVNQQIVPLSEVIAAVYSTIQAKLPTKKTNIEFTQTSDTSAEISVSVSSTDKVSSQKSATKILKSLSKQMEIVQNDIGESAAISYDIVVKTPVENSIPTDETPSNVKGERTFSRSQATVENHIPVNETNSEQSTDANAPTFPIPSRILSSELNNGVNTTPSVQPQLADIKVNTAVNLSETSSVSTVINHNESIVRDENTREKKIASNVTTLHQATKNERSFNADEVPDIPVDEDSTLPLTNSTSLKSLLKNAQDLGLNVRSVVIRIDSQEIPIEHTSVMPLSIPVEVPRNGEKLDIGIEIKSTGSENSVRQSDLKMEPQAQQSQRVTTKNETILSVVTSQPTKDLIVEALPTQLIDTEYIQPVKLPLSENLPLENIAKQGVKANIAGENSFTVVPQPSTNSQANTKITGTEIPDDLPIEVKALTGKSDETPKLVQVKNNTEPSSIPAPIKGEKFVDNVLTEPIFEENSSSKHTQIPSVKNSKIHEGSDSITYENGKNISRGVLQKSTTEPKSSPSEIVVETQPIGMKDSSDDISVSSLQSRDTQFTVDRKSMHSAVKTDVDVLNKVDADIEEFQAIHTPAILTKVEQRGVENMPINSVKNIEILDVSPGKISQHQTVSNKNVNLSSAPQSPIINEKLPEIEDNVQPNRLNIKKVADRITTPESNILPSETESIPLTNIGRTLIHDITDNSKKIAVAQPEKISNTRVETSSQSVVNNQVGNVEEIISTILTSPKIPAIPILTNVQNTNVRLSIPQNSTVEIPVIFDENSKTEITVKNQNIVSHLVDSPSDIQHQTKDTQVVSNGDSGRLNLSENPIVIPTKSNVTSPLVEQQITPQSIKEQPITPTIPSQSIRGITRNTQESLSTSIRNTPAEHEIKETTPVDQKTEIYPENTRVKVPNTQAKPLDTKVLAEEDGAASTDVSELDNVQKSEPIISHPLRTQTEIKDVKVKPVNSHPVNEVKSDHSSIQPEIAVSENIPQSITENIAGSTKNANYSKQHNSEPKSPFSGDATTQENKQMNEHSLEKTVEKVNSQINAKQTEIPQKNVQNISEVGITQLKNNQQDASDRTTRDISQVRQIKVENSKSSLEIIQPNSKNGVTESSTATDQNAQTPSSPTLNMQVAIAGQDTNVRQSVSSTKAVNKQTVKESKLSVTGSEIAAGIPTESALQNIEAKSNATQQESRTLSNGTTSNSPSTDVKYKQTQDEAFDQIVKQESKDHTAKTEENIAQNKLSKKDESIKGIFTGAFQPVAPPNVRNYQTQLPFNRTLPRVNADNFAASAVQMIQSMPQQTGGSMRLQLAPEALGTVTLQLNVRDKNAYVRLEVETTAAKQALEMQIPMLREQLSQQGITADRIDIQVRQREDSSMFSGFNQQNTSAKQEEQQARQSYLRSLRDDGVLSTTITDEIVQPTIPKQASKRMIQQSRVEFYA